MPRAYTDCPEITRLNLSGLELRMIALMCDRVRDTVICKELAMTAGRALRLSAGIRSKLGCGIGETIREAAARLGLHTVTR